MKIIQCSEPDERQKQAIFRLWNEEYPASLQFRDMGDLERYLAGISSKSHRFLIDEGENVAGWGFLFEREEERWFAIIIEEKSQRLNYGTILLNALKKAEETLNGWVIDHGNEKRSNGVRYIPPLGFYIKHGFSVLPDIRLENEKISAVKIEWKKEAEL